MVLSTFHPSQTSATFKIQELPSLQVRPLRDHCLGHCLSLSLSLSLFGLRNTLVELCTCSDVIIGVYIISLFLSWQSYQKLFIYHL